MVNDGAHNFRLKTYFITPVEQLNQLHELGYSDIKLYSLRDGREIKNPNNAVDRYIYYLSKVPWKHPIESSKIFPKPKIES